MVRGRALDTLEYLQRVARDATATAVVVRAPESIDLFVVDVKVNVWVCLEALEMVELVAGSDNALLNFLLARILRSLGALCV